MFVRSIFILIYIHSLGVYVKPETRCSVYATRNTCNVSSAAENNPHFPTLADRFRIPEATLYLLGAIGLGARLLLTWKRVPFVLQREKLFAPSNLVEVPLERAVSN
jgi:hypothetical protein